MERGKEETARAKDFRLKQLSGMLDFGMTRNIAQYGECLQNEKGFNNDYDDDNDLKKLPNYP